MKPGRVLGVLAVAGAVAFAVQGGEYSTFDLLQLRREEAEEQRRVADLERLVDSLARVARARQSDPKTQERVARESFGMIRRGEFLYKLVPGDTAEAADTER